MYQKKEGKSNETNKPLLLSFHMLINTTELEGFSHEMRSTSKQMDYMMRVQLCMQEKAKQ